MHVMGMAGVDHVLSSYGYYAIVLIVMLESAGVPMPGETILVSASVYAGTKHQLDIRIIIAAAAAAAILGDNLGFWAGRALGGRFLARFGPRVGLDVRKQKLGRYLFKRYGGAVVFFGRFVSVLRAYAALLAGINSLDASVFFVCNAGGAIVWATVFGCGGYLLGQGFDRIAGPVGYVALALALVAAVVAWRFYKKHEERLLETAEREMMDDTVAAPTS